MKIPQFSIPKKNRRSFCAHFTLVITAIITAHYATAATLTHQANTNNLNLSTAWSAGGPPGSGDIALWDATTIAADVAAPPGADVTWGQIKVTNPGGGITISAGNTLTLNGVLTSGTNVGIDMSTASQSLTIAANVTLGAAQQISLAAAVTSFSGDTVSLSTGDVILIASGAAANQISSLFTIGSLPANTILAESSGGLLNAQTGLGNGTVSVLTGGTLAPVTVNSMDRNVTIQSGESGGILTSGVHYTTPYYVIQSTAILRRSSSIVT